MCGIVGLHNRRRINPQLIASACNKMKRRGPDHEGLQTIEEEIIFGHVRLSILDLTVGSNQPFSSICGRYTIVFNGEIYNFKEIKSMMESEGCVFRTDGDTEVLLQLYIKKGSACLKYLRGMFAFCIWDSIKRTFFLARDVSGEKPLFYCNNNSAFGFASTLTALMELKVLPNVIDHNQALHYLHDGYSEGDKSLITGVRKLEPGTFLEYDIKTGNQNIERYWTIPKYDQDLPSFLLEKDLLLILEQAVEEQLFADVQTSVLLSGGLDSSLVTALASRIKKNVKTFSVCFTKNKKNDEIKYANKISQYFNTSHNVLNVGGASLSSLIEVCDNIDEPFIDSSMIPTTFLAREVGKYTKVVLGGDGADELFGGYNHYKRLAMLDKIHKNRLLRKTLNASVSILNKFESDSNSYKWLDIACQNLISTVPKTAVYFRDPSKWFALKAKIDDKEIKHKNRLLEASMEFDFNNYLPSDILVKVDRAMMSASVESRSPFLDKRVIEFAYSRTPLDKKVSKDGGKVILQNIAKKLLPKDYEFGRKQGFNFNIGVLMADDEVITYMREELNVLDIFDRSLFEGLVNKNKSSHNGGERLYGLFVLAYWMKRNNVKWFL